MKILLTGHLGLGNRGCEALLRSTVMMLRERLPGCRVLVPSIHPAADGAQWPQAPDWGVEWVRAPKVDARLVNWARACRLAPSLAAAPWPLPWLDEEAQQTLRSIDLMLSIGGDNYTLDYDLASLALFTGWANHARRRGVPVVLWGASVGPFDAWPSVGRRMRRHLSALNGITVRETESLKVLQAQGLGLHEAGPQVQLVSDPAFTLPTEAVPLEPHWPDGTGPVVGLNLSPLAVRSQTGESAAQARRRFVQEAAAFIERLLRRDMARVLLVTHVSALDAQGQVAHAIAPAQDDARLLDEVMQALGPRPPLRRLPTWNAAQLKHAIAQCDVFIGARTHSVIGALSSGVPAVALAYSLKARGIHRDLLGHEDGVLDVRDLDADRLHQAWQALRDRAEAERRLLQHRRLEWQARARAGLDTVDVSLRQPASIACREQVA